MQYFFFLPDEFLGEGCGFAVGEVVAQLEEASVVEAVVAEGGVAELGGEGEEVGGFAVDDTEIRIKS